MTDRREVYEAVDGERAYQEQVWHRKETNDVPSLSIGDYILLVEEYAKRARSEWSFENPPEVHALHVMRKIAALAVACMEEHGAPRRGGFENVSGSVGE